MINAQTLSLQLGGHWYGSYGVAPCPICQSERRKDQNALTLSDGESKLLVHCKKDGCSFHSITVAAGVRQDTYRPPSLSTIAQNREHAQKSTKHCLKKEKTENLSFKVLKLSVLI